MTHPDGPSSDTLAAFLNRASTKNDSNHTVPTSPNPPEERKLHGDMFENGHGSARKRAKRSHFPGTTIEISEDELFLTDVAPHLPIAQLKHALPAPKPVPRTSPTTPSHPAIPSATKIDHGIHSENDGPPSQSFTPDEPLRRPLQTLYTTPLPFSPTYNHVRILSCERDTTSGLEVYILERRAPTVPFPTDSTPLSWTLGPSKGIEYLRVFPEEILDYVSALELEVFETKEAQRKDREERLEKQEERKRRAEGRTRMRGRPRLGRPPLHSAGTSRSQSADLTDGVNDISLTITSRGRGRGHRRGRPRIYGANRIAASGGGTAISTRGTGMGRPRGRPPRARAGRSGYPAVVIHSPTASTANTPLKTSESLDLGMDAAHEPESGDSHIEEVGGYDFGLGGFDGISDGVADGSRHGEEQHHDVYNPSPGNQPSEDTSEEDEDSFGRHINGKEGGSHRAIGRDRRESSGVDSEDTIVLAQPSGGAG